MRLMSRFLVLLLLATFVPQVCTGLFGEAYSGNQAGEQIVPVKNSSGHIQMVYEAFTEVEEEESGRESLRDVYPSPDRFQSILFFSDAIAARFNQTEACFRVPRIAIFVKIHSLLI